MRSVKSRLLSLLLALLMLPLFIHSGAITAKAAYENTYVNTGDQRADLIGVALTQVGYHEEAGGYTKYGAWYGAPYTDWCGMFISWCANQAGIPTSVLRKNGFASASSFGIPTYYASQKTPRPGDLFFKTNGSHAGIVYYVEGNYFYTLEGNTYESGSNGNCVMIRRRALGGSYYFGEPPYQSDAGHNYVKGIEAQHPHKEYYKCTDCSSMYYTGKYGTISTCQECVMASCTHQYGTWSQVDEQYHQGICSLCTKKQAFKHDWGSDKILKEATCEEAGLKRQTCGTCGAVREVEIPTTNDHQYGDWIFSDNDYHYRTCQTCGREQMEKHTEGQWESDRFEHWFVCPDCGGRADMEAHDFPDGCESACTVCRYTLPTGHLFIAQWQWDESGHWHGCENCSAREGYEAHIFSADCDETCDLCSYTRERDHNYSEEWSSDEAGHYHACQDCGKVEELLAHTPGDAATEQTPQLCTTCGYEIVAALSHVHTFDYEYDDSTHWGSCECGRGTGKQGHIWDLGTGSCKVCNAPLPQIEETQIPWIVILPAVAAVAAAGAVTLGIVLHKKKKAPIGV